MSNLNFYASPNLTHYSPAQIPLALIRLYYVAGLKFSPTNLSTMATWFLGEKQALRSILDSGHIWYDEDMKTG